MRISQSKEWNTQVSSWHLLFFFFFFAKHLSLKLTLVSPGAAWEFSLLTRNKLYDLSDNLMTYHNLCMNEWWVSQLGNTLEKPNILWWGGEGEEEEERSGGSRQIVSSMKMQHPKGFNRLNRRAADHLSFQKFLQENKIKGKPPTVANDYVRERWRERSVLPLLVLQYRWLHWQGMKLEWNKKLLRLVLNPSVFKTQDEL